MDGKAAATADRRRGRVWGALVLGTIAMLCALVLWALVLWHSTPGFWQAAMHRRAALDDRREAATALAFESRTNHALTALPRSAGDHQRVLEVPLDDVNDWLAQRLRLWLQNQGVTLPTEIQAVVVAADPPQLLLAALVQTPDVTQVFSLALSVAMEPDGTAILRLERILGGRLPLPVGMALREIPPDVRSALPPDVLQVTESMRAGLRVEPVFRIDSTRRVRVLDLEVHDDSLTLRIQQEPAE